MAQKLKTPKEEIKRIEFEYFFQRGAKEVPDYVENEQFQSDHKES